jgi:hypothetical protein
MNKFKFDFNYIKKNLNQKNFLKDIYVLEKDSNKVSGDKYGGGDMFFKVIRNSFDGDDDAYGMLLNDYDDKKNKEFKLKINKYQFDGTLLPKLSENFKLEQYFDFCLESHYLIYSKSKKDYLYIFCHRPTFYAENASIYEKYDLVDNYVKEVLKKKLNKIQFFEFLIKRDKKIGLFQSYAYEGFYTSTDGVDYNYLYEQGKLK